MTAQRAKNGNPHICCTCSRRLDPHRDAVVYLGWGRRHDGRPGPGWVVALCAAQSPSLPSPCVASARTWAEQARVTFVPSDYATWLGRDSRRTA